MSHHRKASSTPAKQCHQIDNSNSGYMVAINGQKGFNTLASSGRYEESKKSGPGQLHGCSQLLANILTGSSDEEDMEKLDQSTLSARSAAEESSSAAKAPQAVQTKRPQSQPPTQHHSNPSQHQQREFTQTLYPQSTASLATFTNQFAQTLQQDSTKSVATTVNSQKQKKTCQFAQHLRSASVAKQQPCQFAEAIRPEPVRIATVANQKQQQYPHQFAQTLHPEIKESVATVANQQQHPQCHFSQTLRPESKKSVATVANQQQQQPPEPLAASLPIMPTGSDRPVRDTDGEQQPLHHHRHHHQHQSKSVCRHGNPVKSRHRTNQHAVETTPPMTSTAVGVGDVNRCAIGGCQSSQELLARLASTEAALERSRAEAEARLSELCARENELMRLRHDALKREARLRAEADKEREARNCAEARADALEKETRRLAAALAERDLQLRACQDKMRRINRSLGYIARASSDFAGVSSGAAAAAAAAAEATAAAKVAKGNPADATSEDITDEEDETTDAEADTDCDASIASAACSCHAGASSAAGKPKTWTVFPSPLATAGQQQRGPSEFVQPSPPTLDVCKPTPPAPTPPQAEKASRSDRPDPEDADDREFRLGLARIDDQIRRLQASLKSPNGPV